MNIFKRIMTRRFNSEKTLGNPLNDPAAILRRQNYFATMTGGKGFLVPPMSPKKDSQGRTRGDRKRMLREATNRQIRGA